MRITKRVIVIDDDQALLTLLTVDKDLREALTPYLKACQVSQVVDDYMVREMEKPEEYREYLEGKMNTMLGTEVAKFARTLEEPGL